MDELQHFGIKGMKWGRRKPELPPVTIKQQAVNILRRDMGIVRARAMLKRYGNQAVPTAKLAAKGTVGLLKYSARAAKGAGTAVRLLGTTAKVGTKFGKAYVKGAVKIAKMVK